jgi:transcription elongation factor Elf1
MPVTHTFTCPQCGQIDSLKVACTVTAEIEQEEDNPGYLSFDSDCPLSGFLRQRVA